MKRTKYIENRLFFGLPVYERKLPRKIGKQKVQVQSRYFHFAFKRTISDVPLWSSSRHKMTTFDAYVKKESKKKMAHETSSGAECDAKLVRISMNEKSRIHKKTSRYSYDWVWNLFRENLYTGCRIWLSPSTKTVRNVEYRSISWSRKVDI